MAPNPLIQLVLVARKLDGGEENGVAMAGSGVCSETQQKNPEDNGFDC